MLTEKYYEFLKGTVNFSAQEGFSENFLRTCKRNKISLFSVNTQKSSVIGKIYHKDKKKLFDAAKKSGMTLNVTSEYGLPYIIKKMRYRFGIPIGLCAALVICTVLSSVLWSVSISTNGAISNEECLDILKSIGIKTGAFTSIIDCREAERVIEDASEKIYKATVNIVGSCLFVNILEREPTSDTKKTDYYTNITAAKDGEIIRCDILAGTGLVKNGTPVVKGDMLVSGTVELNDGRTRFVESKAVIVARTVNNKTVPASLKFTAQEVTKSSNIYHLAFFGLTLPFVNDKHDSYFSAHYMNTSSSILPVGIIRENRVQKSETEISLTKDEAILLAYSDYACALLKEYSDCVILSRDEKVIDKQQISIEAKIVCEEDIVNSIVFEVEKTNE